MITPWNAYVYFKERKQNFNYTCNTAWGNHITENTEELFWNSFFFFFFYLREYRGQPEMSKILSQPSENLKNKQTDLEENILSHRLRSHLELGWIYEVA